MIKVALLSRWHVHADDYVREINENKNISIKLVWDEEIIRGEEWAKELGVPFEKDLKAVLSNPEIDAVIVNTPTSLHKDVIVAAANNNKHIFTEKVLAFTAKDCDEIYQAVESAGVKLMVSLPRLTSNNFLYAEKALKENWIGKLTMIRCRFAHDGAVVSEGEESGWLPTRFFDQVQAGGGAMIDLGAHPIYLVNRLAGKAKAVYARLNKVISPKVDDNSALLVDYESGAIGIIETSFVSNSSPFQLELYGTIGTLLINEGDISVASENVNDGKLTKLTEALPELALPMEQWVDAILNGSTPTITKEDVINLSLLNEAAFLSNEEGRRVEVDKVK
ncbi:Gfo/Idh/MocA family oxidoreductase [Sporosarcina sp. Marseille-Q4063]|uniref:Gfo/Idh/MocA family protein n=1 Tax=Sporosarcina sp. Marseille-Q4063 TaxID=2810514 RepID=UPI001BAE95A3|nr:Gfo/Idh/MocA family oxidoreductase [Sporosarcina sp. Marseille-Q4063]QUW21519.1 Gfo/Idh/MocA family oxidoreductase [Sporosarcina sp. Marseille-Q4063]